MEQYLGDGVYATYDGYGIWLDLRGQDDTTRIYLEPDVLFGLNRFFDSATSIKNLRSGRDSENSPETI